MLTLEGAGKWPENIEILFKRARIGDIILDVDFNILTEWVLIFYNDILILFTSKLFDGLKQNTFKIDEFKRF